MKDRYEAEKKVIDDALASGHKLCNNPPGEPYFVDTAVPIEGEILTTVPDLNKAIFNFSVGLNIHVETACKHPIETLHRLVSGVRRGRLETWVDPREFPKTTFSDFDYHTVNTVVVLEYPIERPMAFESHMKVKRFISVGDLVWSICQAYRVLYLDPKRYGIWGHALGDLYIEALELDTEKMILMPGIGS
jgi:hypothetical protein